MTAVSLAAPQRERNRARSNQQRRSSALQGLCDSATLCVDELRRALERLPGHPYADELVAVTTRLHNRDIEGAVQGWRAIPWTYENERGYGGLAICEARDARVKAAARALETSMARLKVCFRYGYIPKATPRQPAEEPLLF